MLKKDSLKGALIYYDGQHNDARMNLAIILSAIRHGAKCVNHTKVRNPAKLSAALFTQVQHLLKNEDGKVMGARVRDQITGAEWDIKVHSI